MTLSERQREMCEASEVDYSDLSALFLNCTLKPSPATSRTRRSEWEAGCRFDHPNPEHR